MLSWSWMKNSEMVSLWVYLLLTAQYEDTYEEGVYLKRGQVKFGRKKASQDLGISETTIRTCIKRLKMAQQITTKPTNKYTIITILKYDDYQGGKKKTTNNLTTNLTNNQPTTNQQTNHIQEDKEYKKNIYDVVSKKRFIDFKNKWVEAGYDEQLVDTALNVCKQNLTEENLQKVMGILTNSDIANPIGYIQTLKQKGAL